MKSEVKWANVTFKKHIAAVFIGVLPLLLCLSLSSCYNNERPERFNYSRWACEEYDAWFVVLDGWLYGKAMIDWEEQEIRFLSDYGNQFMWIHWADAVLDQAAGFSEEEGMVWSGEVHYSAEQMTLYNASFSTGIFGELENEAVFIRKDSTEEEIKTILENEGIEIRSYPQSSREGDESE